MRLTSYRASIEVTSSVDRNVFRTVLVTKHGYINPSLLARYFYLSNQNHTWRVYRVLIISQHNWAGVGERKYNTIEHLDWIGWEKLYLYHLAATGLILLSPKVLTVAGYFSRAAENYIRYPEHSLKECRHPQSTIRQRYCISSLSLLRLKKLASWHATRFRISKYLAGWFG